MSNLKKNIFFAFGSQGLQLLRSILVSLLIPKTLGIEEFGFWQLFIFYTQYSGFLHLGLLDGIYLREGGKHYKELDFRSLGAQFRIFLIWQFIIIIPFIILGLNSSDINRTIIIISSCIYAIINNTSRKRNKKDIREKRFSFYTIHFISICITSISNYILYAICIMLHNVSSNRNVISYIKCKRDFNKHLL